MKFYALAVLALSAFASAELRKVVRQNGGVDASLPAMTDASGNVVPYDAAAYSAAKAAGLTPAN